VRDLIAALQCTFISFLIEDKGNLAVGRLHNRLIVMARPTGFEPVTPAFEVLRSDRLSCAAIKRLFYRSIFSI